MNTGSHNSGLSETETLSRGVFIMGKEDRGFISVTNSINEVKNLFVGNEIPQEGEVLELVVVKSKTTDDSCALVLKLRSVQD